MARIMLKPFAQIRDISKVYPTDMDQELQLKHSLWLTEHIDKLFDVQLVNIQTYGMGYFEVFDKTTKPDQAIEANFPTNANTINDISIGWKTTEDLKQLAKQDQLMAKIYNHVINANEYYHHAAVLMFISERYEVIYCYYIKLPT